MLLVVLLVADEPEVLPLVAPDVEPEPDAPSVPVRSLVVVPLPVVLPVVPVPAEVPLVAPGCDVLVPTLAPVVPDTPPGWTMAPPLAPSVPVLVAPAEAPEGALLDPDVPDWAYAPPATSDATKMERSLLIGVSM